MPPHLGQLQLPRWRILFNLPPPSAAFDCALHRPVTGPGSAESAEISPCGTRVAEQLPYKTLNRVASCASAAGTTCSHSSLKSLTHIAPGSVPRSTTARFPSSRYHRRSGEVLQSLCLLRWSPLASKQSACRSVFCVQTNHKRR